MKCPRYQCFKSRFKSIAGGSWNCWMPCRRVKAFQSTTTELQGEMKVSKQEAASSSVPEIELADRGTDQSVPVTVPYSGAAVVEGEGGAESAVLTTSGVRVVQRSAVHDGPCFPLAEYHPEGKRVEDSTPSVPDLPPSAGEIIFCKSLSDLVSAAEHYDRIDLTQFSTPERYRFIDCAKFVIDDDLCIWETPQLPWEQYVAISHIWKSLPPELDSKLSVRGDFLVDCEERDDGEPVSIDVLRYTCLASLHTGVRLLWMDRLSILQTPSEKGTQDKRWQIMRMYDVYKGCSTCFVLPAGLRRYPMKFEETDWIERAWTFQEVMVAPVVKVLYTDYVGSPPEMFVHSMHIEEYFKAQLRIFGDDRDGSQERRQRFVQALDSRQYYRDPTFEQLARYRYVWEHVQWRTAAYPVDVVLSVMGLLGVTLDPAQFTKEDRLKATIAMAQELLLKDDSQNTCIEIPLWRRITTSELTGGNVKEYMMEMPDRVRLQELETKLDNRSLRRFAFATYVSFESGLGVEENEVEDKDLERLRDTKGVIWASEPDDEARKRFLAASDKLDIATKSRRKAGRVAATIPAEEMRRAFNQGQQNGQRVLFRTPGKVVIELCRDLLPSTPSERTTTVGSPSSEHVLGWCVQSALWVRIGKYAGSYRNRDGFDRDRIRSLPVPIITLWKFRVP